MTLEFSPFLWSAPPLETRRECPEFFPEQAAKVSLISSNEAETGLLWMWPGPSCFLSSGDGYVGELLELQQGCEGPFVLSRVRCDYPRDASVEMGLIYPLGEYVLDFLKLSQVLSSYDGDERDRLWWPQDWSVPIRVVRGLLGIPLPLMPGPKTLCGVGPGT